MEVENRSNFPEEVQSIFSDLVKFREEGNRIDKQKSEEFGPSIKGSWFALSSLAFVLFYVFILVAKAYFSDWFETYFLWWLPVFVTLSLSLLVSMVFEVRKVWGEFKSFFKDTTLDLLSAQVSHSKRETQLIESFSKYSTTSLIFVSEKLNDMSRGGGIMIGNFIGILSKVGIIPAVVAIALSISKLGESDFYLYDVLTIFVIGIYFLCFNLATSDIFFKRYAFLIDFHLEHICDVDRS